MVYEIKEVETEKIEVYPKEIQNDKISCKVWDIIRRRESTRTVIKNVLYEELFKELSSGKECFEVIDDLISKGLIKLKTKNTEIQVLSTEKD